MKIIIGFILTTGIVLTVLLLLLLLKSNKRELHKTILIVFYVFILLVNLHSFANLHGLETLYKFTFLFDFTIIWLFAPLLFVYIKSIFEPSKELLKRNLLHFLPCILFVVGIGLPLSLKYFTSENSFGYLSFFEKNQSYIAAFRNVYFVVYIFLSLKLFNNYRNAMKLSYSNLSNKDFGWVKKLLYGCLFFISIDIIARIEEAVFDNSIINMGYFTMCSIVIVIVYLGYYGVNQSKILLPDFLIHSSSKYKTELKDTNDIQTQDSEELQSLRLKLDNLFEVEKVYLDEKLTLYKLAQKIQTTDKKLSFLLNKSMNTTFYDYVNSFRVEAVKLKLVSEKSKKFTILAIAHECGFNSKASFNRIFKKSTGLSPSEFKKLN